MLKQIIMSIFVLICAFFIMLIYQTDGIQHPDMLLTTPEMIERHGYTSETHRVTTEDGYILNLHRIPNPGKQPVLLNHGILMSSVDYVITGPGRALAYVLHEAGYDVWLGNARGNLYCNGHTKLNNSQPEYWEFSFHEMGIYDLPAEIDYILETTAHSKLTYVGFSMGTTMLWVLMSERPEYNNKIVQMHALAPTAYRGKKGRSFNFAKKSFSMATSVMNYLNWGQFLPSTNINKLIAKGCNTLESVGGCRRLFLSLYGQGSQQIDERLLPVLINHFPAGTSVKTMRHVSQLLDIDRFWQYDYGLEDNIKKYNSPKPPEYKLSNVLVPVYIHYSEKDTIASPTNVKKLCSLIENCMEMRLVEESGFVHLDFTWGKDARELVYNHMVSIMKKS